uniref:Golgi associated, gamma adaptin ear containing, ARF binding protein 1 n=1 Tax=Oryzias sinensis TaxID=183150 RepID=A0A8C7ZBS3_9TELE
SRIQMQKRVFRPPASRSALWLGLVVLSNVSVFSILSDRATNPLNRETDWSSIHAFCNQLNNDLEGPQLATRLLAHKIQSPQEWEATQALLVLETCMKNCGKRFHSEVGKFRFLNELIKVVSPKYLGSRSPEPVKKKVLELIYSWTLALPDEAKISDAYQMLKKQGIIKQDPELPPDKLLKLPPPRPKNAVFEDEEKSKMLSRLLNSSHPEDLKAANKLIKEMVQEDQRRAEKVSKRVNAIQEVKESVALLTQLLQDYDSSTRFCLCGQDLYQRCEKMRPTLFRLASDTEDNDEALAEILQANDSLTHVINLYKQQVKGEIVNGNNTLNAQKLTGSSSVAFTPEHPARLPNLGATLLEKSPTHFQAPSAEVSLSDVFVPLESIKPSKSKLNHLISRRFSFLIVFVEPAQSLKPSFSSAAAGSLLPVTVFDGNSLRVLFHFARDSPPSRPDVLVVIISMLSSAPVPVTNINFQTTAPKSMAVKLQPPSGTELPAFNPILPPAAITQILLVSNPNKERVKLQYTLSFSLGEERHSESGSIEQFPPPGKWGQL